MTRFVLHLATIAVFAFTLSLGMSAAIYERSYAQGSATAATEIPQTPQAAASEQPAIKVAPPTPDTDAGGFTAELGAAWSRGAYLTVCLLVLYGALAVARKRVKWLATGRRAVVTAAAVTALATAIIGLSTGNGPTLAWAFNALAAGFALYLRPEGAIDAPLA